MSVAFESNNTSSDSFRIQSQGFSHGMWIYNRSESARFVGGNSWSSRLPVVIEEEDASNSSSIGNNSDVGCGSDSDEDDGEVQSMANGPLNGLKAFEEVLPIKRGISTFYAGKSKSFGTLADASSVPSIQDIVKPEDAYSRKRKNMLAHNVLLDRHRNSSGTSKRLAHSNRCGLGFGSNINNHNSDGCGGSPNSNSPLPPLPRNSGSLPSNESSDTSPRLYSSSWRSLSLSDLEHASAATSDITGSISVTVQQSHKDQYNELRNILNELNGHDDICLVYRTIVYDVQKDTANYYISYKFTELVHRTLPVLYATKGISNPKAVPITRNDNSLHQWKKWRFLAERIQLHRSSICGMGMKDILAITVCINGKQGSKIGGNNLTLTKTSLLVKDQGSLFSQAERIIHERGP